MTSVICVERLGHVVRPHFWSRPHAILSDVTFSVSAGEIFGFLGPNGAGKTTTIKALLGLIRPSRGSLTIFDRPVDEVTVRRQLGYMPEHAYFPEQLTGRELLLQHGVLAGLTLSDARQRGQAALARVGLGEAGSRRLRTYSKGMLQRVGLAQALIGDPALVVLDEPMSGLDPIGRRDVREIMLDLKRQGKTVFFSTHILPDVEAICDRTAIIVSGTTRKVGRLSDLVGEDVDRVEVTSRPFAGRVPDETARLCLRVEVRGDEIVFEVRDVAQANALLDDLRRRDVAVLGMQTLRRSLEDVFVHATKPDQAEVQP